MTYSAAGATHTEVPIRTFRAKVRSTLSATQAHIPISLLKSEEDSQGYAQYVRTYVLPYSYR